MCQNACARVNPQLYQEVREVLDVNKAQRHIREGSPRRKNTVRCIHRCYKNSKEPPVLVGNVYLYDLCGYGGFALGTRFASYKK